MREIHVMVADVLSAELDALHSRHGPWRLMSALAGVIVRRSLWGNSGAGRGGGNHLADLNGHMRRDIGLIDYRDLRDEHLQGRVEWQRLP